MQKLAQEQRTNSQIISTELKSLGTRSARRKINSRKVNRIAPAKQRRRRRMSSIEPRGAAQMSIRCLRPFAKINRP